MYSNAFFVIANGIPRHTEALAEVSVSIGFLQNSGRLQSTLRFQTKVPKQAQKSPQSLEGLNF